MKYYYTDSQNKPTGPVDIEQLRGLHDSGVINADTPVIAEGANDWTALGTLIGNQVAPAAARAEPASGTAAGLVTRFDGWSDSVLAAVHRLLSEDFLARNLDRCLHLGKTLTLVGVGLGAVYSLVLAVRSETFGMVFAGLGLTLFLALLVPVSRRLFAATQELSLRLPSFIGSVVVFDSIALVLIGTAVAVFAVGIDSAIAAEHPWPFFAALLAAVYLVFGAGVLLNPKLSKTATEAQTLAEDALGVASFLGKVLIVLLPLLYLEMVCAGILVVLASCLSGGNCAQAAVFGRTLLVGSSLYSGCGGQAPGFYGVILLIQACLLPLAGYFGFLLFALCVGLLRAVIGCPRRPGDAAG
jgi:hypothetical protein